MGSVTGKVPLVCVAYFLTPTLTSWGCNGVYAQGAPCHLTKPSKTPPHRWLQSRRKHIPNLIQLTKGGGDPVWINPAFIVWVDHYSLTSQHKYTRISFAVTAGEDGGECSADTILAQETPEQILELIKENKP